MNAEVEDRKDADDRTSSNKARRPLLLRELAAHVDAMGLFGLTFPEAYGALRMMSEWKDRS
jgi:hypothetical protein